MTLRLPALIPVNRLDRAKGRLAGFLAPAERRALALATLETVLTAVEEAGWSPVVLTRDEEVRVRTAARALVLDEVTPLLGLNAELEAALLRLQPHFPQPEDPRLLILHADLPLATGAAIRELAAAAPAAPSTTLARSSDGGTNAMLMRPPGSFKLSYGPGSCALHHAAALKAGHRVELVESAELSLDLDTPEDLATFLGLAGAGTTRAGQLLVEWGIQQRLRG